MGKLKEQLKNIGSKAKDFVVKTTNNIMENVDDKKFLDEKLKNEPNYLEFTVHVLDEKEKLIKNIFVNKFCGLLIREENKIRVTEQIKMAEGQYLQDKNNNKYYITFISPTTCFYTVSKDNKELKKELTEIEYTNKAPEKPLPNIVNNITNNDYSTNIKGNKGNINSDNAKIEKTTNIEVELNANLHKE